MADIKTLLAAYDGSTTKAARAVGVPVQTLDSWKSRGSIPHWRIRDVEAALVAANAGRAE